MKWDSWSFESALQRSIISETDKHDITLRWYRLDDQNEFELDEIEEIQNYVLMNIPIDPMMDINCNKSMGNGAKNFMKFMDIKNFYER